MAPEMLWMLFKALYYRDHNHIVILHAVTLLQFNRQHLTTTFYCPTLLESRNKDLRRLPYNVYNIHGQY